MNDMPKETKMLNSPKPPSVTLMKWRVIMNNLNLWMEMLVKLKEEKGKLPIIQWIEENCILENPENNTPKIDPIRGTLYAVYKWKIKPEITIEFFQYEVLVKALGRCVGSYSLARLNNMSWERFQSIIEQNDNGIPTREEGFQNRT